MGGGWLERGEWREENEIRMEEVGWFLRELEECWDQREDCVKS